MRGLSKIAECVHWSLWHFANFWSLALLTLHALVNCEACLRCGSFLVKFVSESFRLQLAACLLTVWHACLASLTQQTSNRTPRAISTLSRVSLVQQVTEQTLSVCAAAV